MPEGPSLVIAREEMLLFKGRKVIDVSGNSKIDQQRLLNKKLLDIRTWGKHLLLEFSGFTVRVHFLMFGKYLVNDTKETVPRLHLQFAKGELNFYTCAIKMIGEPLNEVYDWEADVLSDVWNPKAAKKKLSFVPHKLVTDALLDQTIFSGVGNIIKNEVLYRIKVHPETPVGKLPTRKLNEMIKEARNYSFDFLEWKREFTLRSHWLVHRKSVCGRDGNKITREYLGTTNRRTFFCTACQKLY